MGRKTDVGVLSVYMTADTQQFTHALRKSGQATKAWSLKVQSSMNVLKGTFTEALNKITLIVAAAQAGMQTITASFSLFEYVLTGASKHLDTFLARMSKLPIVGGFVSEVSALTKAITGLFIATARLTEEEKDRINLFPKILRERARLSEYLKETMRMRRELQRGRVTEDAWLQSELERLEKITLEEIKILGLRHKKLENLKQGNEVAEHARTEQRLNLQREMMMIRQRMEVVRLDHLDRIKLVQEKRKAEADALAEQLQAEKDAAAKSLQIEKDRNRKMLTDRMAAQTKSMMSAMQGMRYTGATASVSTAIGSFKVADDTRNAAIQRRQLEELLEQVELLKLIRQEVREAGGVLL